MIRNYYKKHITIGIIFFLITVGLIIVNPLGHESSYYWILYNRAYFSMMYLPLFLFGMLPVLADLYISECIIRYPSRKDVEGACMQRIFAYAMYSSFLFCSTVFLAEKIFSIKINGFFEQPIVFYFLSFLFQCTGWILIGMIAMLLYMKIRNLAAVWGTSFLLMVFFTIFGEKISQHSFFRYIISPYHRIYQVMAVGDMKEIGVIFFCGIIEIIGLACLIHQCFCSGDFLGKQKEG